MAQASFQLFFHAVMPHHLQSAFSSAGEYFWASHSPFSCFYFLPTTLSCKSRKYFIFLANQCGVTLIAKYKKRLLSKYALLRSVKKEHGRK